MVESIRQFVCVKRYLYRYFSQANTLSQCNEHDCKLVRYQAVMYEYYIGVAHVSEGPFEAMIVDGRIHTWVWRING